MPARHRSEARRLSVLRGLAILDTPAEPDYDDIARLASTFCGAPVGAVNFVDDERQWTKAIIGLEGGQGASVSADISFCAAAIATDGGLLNVPDTLVSARRQRLPVVNGAPVRFYAGAAIVVSGEPVGVVCVFGDEPHELQRHEEFALVALARQAAVNLELRRHNSELRALAVSDPLTGLANRTLLFDHVEVAIAQRRRYGGEVGVLFCDLDGFKGVNDRLGHRAGDSLLCQTAERLRAAARDTDTVARLAGDEFVVVCPGLENAADLDAVVARFDRVVHFWDPSDPDGVHVRLTIGAALLTDTDTAASVVARADQAMYRAKAQGSNPYVGSSVEVRAALR